MMDMNQRVVKKGALTIDTDQKMKIPQILILHLLDIFMESAHILVMNVHCYICIKKNQVADHKKVNFK